MQRARALLLLLVLRVLGAVTWNQSVGHSVNILFSVISERRRAICDSPNGRNDGNRLPRKKRGNSRRLHIAPPARRRCLWLMGRNYARIPIFPGTEERRK